MHSRTLILLVLLVGGLGALAWWQARREDSGVFDGDRALLEGFDRTRVSAFHLDNLERSLQMRAEAQPDGTFLIVDPVDFPAEPAVIEILFDLLANQRAIVVQAGDLKKLSLDPPRVVLEIEERTAGAPRVRRIELGAIDVDQQHVFARVEGQLVRTERALDATLDRDLPDWRARRILALNLSAVVEIHRRGEFHFPEEPTPSDLTLDVVLDGAWRAAAPFGARLQTSSIALLLASIAFLQVDSFIDVPGDLANYGLDKPKIEIQVLDANGKRDVLRLAPEPGRERWFAAREGSPHVYRVSQDSVTSLAMPSRELIDRKLVDLVREKVEKIVLEADGRSTTLARAPRGWTLSVREGERVLIDGEPADATRVADLLATLERTKFSGLLFERTLDASQAIGAIHVSTSDDEQGGILGPLFHTGDGAEGVPFRRDGDALVAALDPSVLALARTDPNTLRSLELHKVPELEVARIELKAAGVERNYVRNASGRWSRAGSELEARDFAKLVDRVLSLRAVEVLKRSFDDRLDAPIDVHIVSGNGNEVVYTLGRWSDPAGGEPYVVYRTDKRMARLKPELYEALRALLAAE